MVQTSPQGGMLLAAFRTFHAEVVRLREGVERQPWMGGSESGSGPDGTSGPSARDRVLGIQAELDAVLKRLEAGARAASGSRGGQQMREAGYFMVALADEVFLTLAWDGKDAWNQLLLEGRLYGSHAAGETVFSRAEQILAAGQDREMAAVVLCALALGFEGQHRGRGEPGMRAIRDLKGRLLRFTQRDGPPTETSEDGLFPQVYRYTIETQPLTRLPRVASWTLVIGLLVGLQLLISHWVWVDLSASIRQVTEGLVWLQGGSGS